MSLASGPRQRSLRPLAAAVVAVTALVVLAFYVFPTRTWLEQRSALDDRSSELGELRAERAALERRVEQLSDPDFVERVARSDYGLVRPGEEAYVVLPPSSPQSVLLARWWPFDDPTADPAPDDSHEPGP